MALAKQFNVWVILGSAHYIDKGVMPTNCLIISNKGKIVDRYDKSMLTEGGDGSDDVFIPPAIISLLLI